ncbi:hypothetical protein [Joostella sp.]|uniref:hypothetical protein n=1 Tax=Joostella sp. TaxID=2231138 RepID=UPI003A93302D
MKKLLFLGLFLVTIAMSAQENVNNYKYIVVPKKFDFLKEKNQYRVNTYTKFLFEKAGFNAIYDDQKPADLQANPCLGLKAEIVDDSNLFTTKLRVSLENCQGNIVYTSDEGKSKEKDYEEAYQDAIENAFVSVKELNYKYEPGSTNTKFVLGRAVVEEPAPVSTAAIALGGVTSVSNETQKVATQAAAPVAAVSTTVEDNGTTLFAQPTATGFQLVDMSPKVVFKITKTTQPNYFIIKDKNGFLYQKDGKWIAEYYEGDVLKQEVLNIKF